MDYTTLLIYVTAFIALTLPPLYQWSSKGHWWHDPLGIHLMAFMFVQAVVFNTWALARILRSVTGGIPEWYSDWVILGSFSAMPLVLAWRAAELIRAGQDVRRYPVTREVTTMNTLAHPPMYAKAIYAAAVTFLGGVITALDDGITTAEWLGVSLTTIIVTGGVFGLTNARAQEE